MANAAELVIVSPRRDRMGESFFFCLKPIELKCLLDSQETTQMQDIDFQHGTGGEQSQIMLYALTKKVSLLPVMLFFLFDTKLFSTSIGEESQRERRIEMKSRVGCDRPSRENL